MQLHKVSQPMAARGSSPFASGVTVRKVDLSDQNAPDTRGGLLLPPTVSLLDTQSGVGNSVSGREALGKPVIRDQETEKQVGPPRVISGGSEGLSGLNGKESLSAKNTSRQISFMVPQCPKGKQRHQTVVTLRCERCQRTVKGQRKECPSCLNQKMYFLFSNEYTPAEQRDYETFVALCAQQGMRGAEKFTGPTKIDCRFFFCIPKTRERKLKDGDWHTQRPDTDNCVKSVWDAMNKICFADDCMIVQMTAEKRWTSGIPRCEVTISSL